jgi:hypothetical protein
MSAPKMMPALLGGLFIGVLSSLPYIKGGNVCCCLWVISGGVLAAWLMQQNTARPITIGEGALVGLLAGLAGTLVWVVWSVVGLMLFGTSPFDVADFQRAMTEGGRDVPPEAREALENLTPGVILVVGGVIWAGVSMVFATLGGLLGALLFRRKGPTAGVPTPTGTPGPGSSGPTFTPPTFTPPAPVAPPPPFVPPPPAPPAAPSGLAPPPLDPLSRDADATPLPGAQPAPSGWPAPPPGGWPPPSDDPYVGDAPTIMIPARGPALPTKPGPALPAKPSPPEPPDGAVPPVDREPDSH